MQASDGETACDIAAKNDNLCGSLTHLNKSKQINARKILEEKKWKDYLS